MRILQVKNEAEFGRRAASILAAQITGKPDSVLGLATGSSPVGAYRQLVEWNKQGDLDFSGVTTVNLDEYCGLPKDHPQSYYAFMYENLFRHVNIDDKNVHLPDGLAEDFDAECRRYDDLISRLGGIDLQLLGIGHDGHIGFNEPGEDFKVGTNRVKLTDETLDANARFFQNRDEVPRFAITMGIRAIMQAKKILLVVIGKDKSSILFRALRGPVTPLVQASILQLHPDVTVVADIAALQLFER